MPRFQLVYRQEGERTTAPSTGSTTRPASPTLTGARSLTVRDTSFAGSSGLSVAKTVAISNSITKTISSALHLHTRYPADQRVMPPR